MEYWAMWLVIVLLLAIIEFSTVNLVSIWFVASGFIAMLTSLLTDNFYLQFAVFVIGGIILLLLTKPIIKKKCAEREIKLNLERIIGMEGVVTSEIAKNKIGEVKVDGKLWSAISHSKIPVDATIKATAIDGVKLVVEKVKETAPKTPKKKTAKKKTTTKKVVKKES